MKVIRPEPGLRLDAPDSFKGLFPSGAPAIVAACAGIETAVIEHRMLVEPEQWENYYGGDPQTQRILRRYSHSDRIRYYWADSEIQIARSHLMSNLADRDTPLPLLSQHLPNQYSRSPWQVALRVRSARPRSYRDMQRAYAHACTFSVEEVR